jgi:DNA polymerase-3 subunit gamma/tau
MNCVKEHNADSGLELINTLLQEGYDIQEFLIGLTEHLRNLYIAHHSKQLYLVEASDDTKAKYKQSAPDFSRDDLMRMLHIVSEAQIKIKDAHQPRIQFEITLLKLIHMERSENLAKLLADLEEVKKNSKNLASLTVESENKTSADSEPKDRNAIEEDKPQEIEPTTVIDEEPELQNNTEEIEEEEDEFDLGTPALKTRYSHPEEKDAATEVTIEPQVEQESSNKKDERKPLKIEEIQDIWPTFIESLNGSVSSILKMQTERALPIRLKGTELSLECDNQLAKTMLDEQANDLAGKLQECIGVKLRFNIEVSQKTKQTTARNPYERFKEIQQKDPVVRSLVERFGAELEY